MKWLDSPVVLSVAGTLVIHLVLAVIGDALVAAFPQPAFEPAPVVELVDILPPPPPLPEPPPVRAPDPAPQVAPVQPPAPVEPRPQPRVRSSQPPPTTPPPPSTEPPPPSASPDPGGGPVTQLADIAPEARGSIPVARGPGTGGGGRGGSGGGTGTGTGAGSSAAAPLPASVATIKTRALPRGDFSYFDASKDYPAEAKTLGIEGVIRVRLVVDTEGSVKSAVLINRLGHGLDELALERAKKIKFDPAKDTDDKPVSSVVVWTFNMTLPK